MSITLRAARVNKGLTQKEVAAMMQVTTDTIISWEKAETFPNVPQISKLEKIYDVTYAEINFLPPKFGKTEKGDE